MSQTTHDAETAPLDRAEGGDSRAEVGASVGRYVVLEEVGRGGMGRVLRAYDPKLQREVALKEVRGDVLGEEGAKRLVAEARAMAKLSHPNVVAVYDVEEIDGDRVVLVMEYVAGVTLRSWLKAESRSWREIVARFSEAGRGVAAAHAVGLLHRDFKAANVLVAEAGVKVTDFGLAKMGEGSGSASGFDGPPPDEDGLTEVGVVLGTPRYMAPEQHRGDPLTAAADQFAFCVALWEALCGAAPFVGERVGELKAQGPPPWPGGQTPRRLAEAVRRGLAAHPAERWSSMQALLDALAYDPTRWRNRGLLGVGVIGLIAAGWTSWSGSLEERCTASAARAHLVGVWDAQRRAAVQEAVLGIGVPFAERVWERTDASLTAYADAWTEMHVDACAATSVRGEQSSALMDLRMACLQRAKVELQAVTQVLAEADAQTVQKAHELTGGLRPLRRCADVDALQAEVEPPLPGEAEAVAGVREHVALSRAALRAGQYERALAEVDAAKAELDGMEYRPVAVEVAVAEGAVLDPLGKYVEAEAVQRRALTLAARGRQWEAMQSAATALTFLVGYRLNRFEEGLQHADLARGLAVGDPRAEARVALAVAGVRHASGDYAESLALYEEALALQEEALGPEDPTVARTMAALATVRGTVGAYDKAKALNERALKIYEKTLGPDHPELGAMLNNIGLVHFMIGENDTAKATYERALKIYESGLRAEHPDAAAATANLGNVVQQEGDYDEAAALYERARAIYEAELGPDHPHVGMCFTSLGGVREAQGAHEEAAELHKKALAISEKTMGPEHRDVAVALGNLANVRQAMGRFEESAELRERALGIFEQSVGPEHPLVAQTLNNLAGSHEAMEHYDEARELYERARDLTEQTLGPDNPGLSFPVAGLARIALAQDRPADAVRLAERGLALSQSSGIPPLDRAAAEFTLAQALIAAGGPKDRALKLARSARATAEQAGPAAADKRKAVEAFLATHDR